MVKLTWSCPKMSSKIASFKLNAVTWPLTRKTPSRFKRLHSFLHQLLCRINETSFRPMSFKLRKLATSSSLTLRYLLFSLYSPFENARNPYIETWSFWCSPNVPTSWTALGQTTFFIIRLLIISSLICSNLAITWLISQNQFFPTIDLKFCNVRVGVKNECS